MTNYPTRGRTCYLSLSLIVLSLIFASLIRAKEGDFSVCVQAQSANPNPVGEGPLMFRTACRANEIALASFDGTALQFAVPLKQLNVAADLGEPGILMRSGMTTYQTIIYEAITGPQEAADIIDGVIEHGSVYHHIVSLMAKTEDGRSFTSLVSYAPDHTPGAQDTKVPYVVLFSGSSINPSPAYEVFGVGDRRILRVHGNGQDTLEWSAVVQRFKVLPPGD